ncbi:flagellar hook assembly protein FlgD [Chelatococcus daeguensis]|uniref:Basal-body rod modification protein FlgD n=2 Tax=Chelatococcus TaxID=28209 RepID=A0AAC9NZS5_9HYPH|nr:MULTISPECIES: flagellar hook assembly protein FlgD [Chelatococcus]APF38453.1 flagellar basal body rod modification protein [Chelatococcus daeguensis]KZE34257.1 flagellar basal body rod modification protein [Chelatococcus daeguensis]MBM3083149.1 flagellar hook assembly protein FlgD [Chelatococcus daeguensis]CUA85102.1 Flagellar hook capping protein-N-terminal region [Chelatococcus sambhunathii]
MTVSSVYNVTNTTQTSQSAGTSKTSVDYDTFLKLLVAQLKNQDPTEPMDSTQYMAQLATFSQVEQSVMMNKKLDSLLVASSLQQIDGIIGRTLTTADESISGKVKSVWIYDEGAVAELEDGTRVLLGPGVNIS